MKRKSRAKITLLNNYVPRAETPKQFITLPPFRGDEDLDGKTKLSKQWRQTQRKEKFSRRFLEELTANGIEPNFSNYGYYLDWEEA